MTRSAAAPAAALIGAAPPGLCLDFANTRYWRGTKQPTETLGAPGDLLGWFKTPGGANDRALGALRAEWRRLPQAGRKEFAAALELREAIFRIFAASAGGVLPVAGDLGRLNAALTLALPRRRLSRAKHRFAWAVGGAPLARVLAPVLWSAGDLLAGPGIGRVRQCANPACQWLFLDGSKSGTRRWCAMSACGNRAKAHRHYLKRKRG